MSRTQAVLGSGSPTADILVVGEAPGATEDQTGKPFVGRSGQLLTKILAKAGIKREEVFITNVCRCRPPANRDPFEDEVLACSKHLNATIEIIKPKVLVALGRFAAQALSGTNHGITVLRSYTGTVYKPTPDAGPEKQIPIVCTYHPAYVLRQPSKLSEVLTDLKRVLEYVRESGKEKATSGSDPRDGRDPKRNPNDGELRQSTEVRLSGDSGSTESEETSDSS